MGASKGAHVYDVEPLLTRRPRRRLREAAPAPGVADGSMLTGKFRATLDERARLAPPPVDAGRAIRVARCHPLGMVLTASRCSRRSWPYPLVDRRPRHP